MLKLPHNCTHLTHLQNNAQNSPSEASIVREPWTTRGSSWIYKMQRNQRSNCQRPVDQQESKRVPEKHLFLLYWLCQNLWLSGTNKLENSRDGNTRPPDLPPEKSVCRSRSKRSSLGIDWFQIGRLYIGQPAYLTYMQSTSWETLVWMKHKLELRLPGEISITSDL